MKSNATLKGNIPHHMGHNKDLSQNKLLCQHSHKKYKHMDLCHVFYSLLANLQPNSEDLTRDSCILEVEER